MNPQPVNEDAVKIIRMKCREDGTIVEDEQVRAVMRAAQWMIDKLKEPRYTPNKVTA